MMQGYAPGAEVGSLGGGSSVPAGGSSLGLHGLAIAMSVSACLTGSAV